MFVLNGCIDYEGEVLLGVYASRADANAALEIFRNDAVALTFSSYEIREVEVGAAARFRW